jgi:hypothetical protein
MRRTNIGNLAAEAKSRWRITSNMLRSMFRVFAPLRYTLRNCSYNSFDVGWRELVEKRLPLP